MKIKGLRPLNPLIIPLLFVRFSGFEPQRCNHKISRTFLLIRFVLWKSTSSVMSVRARPERTDMTIFLAPERSIGGRGHYHHPIKHRGSIVSKLFLSFSNVPLLVPMRYHYKNSLINVIQVFAVSWHIVRRQWAHRLALSNGNSSFCTMGTLL